MFIISCWIYFRSGFRFQLCPLYSKFDFSVSTFWRLEKQRKADTTDDLKKSSLPLSEEKITELDVLTYNKKKDFNYGFEGERLTTTFSVGWSRSCVAIKKLWWSCKNVKMSKKSAERKQPHREYETVCRSFTAWAFILMHFLFIRVFLITFNLPLFRSSSSPSWVFPPLRRPKQHLSLLMSEDVAKLF